MEAHGGELVGFFQLVGSRGSEREVVVQRELLCGGDICDRCLLVVVASEVDVLGGAGGDGEAEVQCERALEHPAVGCHDEQTAQEKLERHALTQLSQRQAGAGSVILQVLLERLAECRGPRVLHRECPAGEDGFDRVLLVAARGFLLQLIAREQSPTSEPA